MPSFFTPARWAVLLLALTASSSAYAAVSYPQSNGAGACSFNGNTSIDTTALVISSGPGGAQFVADGAIAVLHCTTLTVANGVTVAVAGTRALDIRVNGAVTIDGIIDASAHGQPGGPGSALVASPDGSNGSGHMGAGGTGNGGGSGGASGAGSPGSGGGGGGAGFAGGGGGAASGVNDHGGQGGGPIHAPGGVAASGGGSPGLNGTIGATRGANGVPPAGGGGGGGGYGNQGPFHAGSGGGGGGSNSLGNVPGAYGGGGGGALRVVSAQEIAFGAGGQITADGFRGWVPVGPGAGGGGGGSGGGIQLIAPVISMASGAQLLARGGIGGLGESGGGDGGMGSPGRIDVTANSTTGLTGNPTPTVTDYSKTLTVTRAGSGGGVVAGSGIACGADCTEEYDPGAIVELTATPDSGSRFSGWTGDCAGTGTCQVTMDQARSVAASFAAIEGTSGGDSTETTTTTASTTTTPSTAPTTTAAPVVTTPIVPKLALSGTTKQPFGERGRFVISVAGTPAGTLTLVPVVKIGKTRVKLAKLTRALVAGSSQKVRVKLPKKALAAVRAALRRHKKVLATVSGTLLTEAGSATAQRTVRASG